MAEHFVITIARQYGSGGFKVAKRLAEELGINCYDSEMLSLVSDPKELRGSKIASDDRIKNTSLFDVAKETYDETDKTDLPKESDDFYSMENLFKYQSQVIEKLAEKESCVIVGRCANYILRDRPNTVRIFFHAPMEFRLNRKSFVHDMLSEKELTAYINRIDKHRAAYYKYYTGYEWMDLRNYDLSLDCSKLGIQNCVDEIKAYISYKKGM